MAGKSSDLADEVCVWRWRSGEVVQYLEEARYGRGGNSSAGNSMVFSLNSNTLSPRCDLLWCILTLADRAYILETVDDLRRGVFCA
jgi:hypothetical protein